MDQIKKLNGGASNEVYQINDTMLLRVFGANSNVLVNQENERHIMNELGKKGISPKILLEFKGGRLEEFIKDSRSLTFNDLTCNSLIFFNLIGKIKEVHNAQINLNGSDGWIKLINNLKDKAIEINPDRKKEHEWERNWQLNNIKEKYTTTPILIENIEKWTEEAKKINPNFYKVYMLKDSILEKLKQVKSLGIVLCHNDLQKNNILVNKDTFDVKLIDFEYSGYNFIEFDIANFLCELQIDYTEDCFEFHDCNVNDMKNITKLICNIYTESEEKSLQLFNNLELFTMAAHYMWIIWAIIKSANKSSFDYIEYANKRMKILEKHI